MQVNKDTINSLSDLSRIKLTEQEKEKFTSQMKVILDSVDVLGEVKSSGTKSNRKTIKFTNLREDKIEPSLSQSEALSNAPQQMNGYMKINGGLTGAGAEG